MENLVIQSKIDNINLIENLINDLADKYDLHADIYGKLLLAVVEGVNNAIIHGNKSDVELPVDVAYEVNDSKVIFCIKDCGAGFDYESIPDPTLPENIKKTNGRGIFLMSHLSDSITFKDNGSLVELEFFL